MLIIKNTSAELTVLKKVKVNAVINGNENTIPHVMTAIVEIHLVNILDDTNSIFAAVVSSEVV